MGDEQLTPEQEKAVRELTEAVAKDLAKGVSKDKLIKQLVKKGVEPDVALQLVGNVERAMEDYRRSPEGRRDMAGAYAKHMVYGVLWFVGGALVTGITYSIASGSPTGGTYFVAWGAMIFGVYDFLKGLIGYLRYSN